MEQSSDLPSISVIVPANNESDYIADCLTCLIDQDDHCKRAEIIVSANACTDDTVQKAKAFESDFAQRGWSLVVLDSREPGKLGALNRAEAVATGASLVYLDADVLCDPPLLGQLTDVLADEAPCYATGTFTLRPAKSWVSRAYGRFWMDLPFMKSRAVGAGLFAVNKAGRARWDAFPDIISDDTFVRLMFKPNERKQVPARYHWPLVEGFSQLIRVRRRQNAGVNELQELYPNLFANELKPEVSLPALMISRPLASVVYIAVQLAVRLKASNTTWARGR